MSTWRVTRRYLLGKLRLRSRRALIEQRKNLDDLLNVESLSRGYYCAHVCVYVYI